MSAAYGTDNLGHPGGVDQCLRPTDELLRRQKCAKHAEGGRASPGAIPQIRHPHISSEPRGVDDVTTPGFLAISFLKVRFQSLRSGPPAELPFKSRNNATDDPQRHAEVRDT